SLPCEVRIVTEARFALTPEIQKTIAAFIRAGAFPEVAAQAAGVPLEVFAAWLDRGRREGARPPYSSFYHAVQQAQAQARVAAERVAFKEKPMDWLKSGPGRDSAEVPGWAAPARPGRRDSAARDALAGPEVQELIAAMLQVLAPYPEARAALVQA